MSFVTEETIEQFTADNRFLACRMLPDGRYVAVIQMLFNLRIGVGVDTTGFEDVWCYHNEALCMAAYTTWDGAGEPFGWYKHPRTGRRRPDFTPESEYVSP